MLSTLTTISLYLIIEVIKIVSPNNDGFGAQDRSAMNEYLKTIDDSTYVNYTHAFYGNDLYRYSGVSHSCKNISFTETFTTEAGNIRFSQVDLSNELKCLNCLIQNYWDRKDFEYPGCPKDSFIPVQKILSEYDDVRQREIERKNITADVSVFVNESNVTQVGLTTAYSHTLTETSSFTFTLSVGIKGKFEFNALGFKFDVEPSLSTDYTWSSLTSNATRITAPSQKVTIPPYSRIESMWTLYKVKSEFNYTVNVLIDDNGQDQNSYRFRKFKEHLRDEKVTLHCRKNEACIHLTGNDIFLSKVPVKQIVNHYRIEYKISKLKPYNFLPGQKTENSTTHTF